MAELKKIGRYEVKGEVGRGGMAVVYRAYDPRFERDVAIKVLPHEFLHDPQFRTRFEREAKTIALLEHPAIVPVYDFGEEDGEPYIVMRFMSGGSLSDRIKQGPSSNKEVLEFFSRLAPALDAAHARGIIHRDIKPGNILYDQYGNPYLSDFGIARITQSASSATLTGGNILGTPAYMSPEQVQGDKELDGRSDIYAMGVILYQLLAGTAPYQATTPARVMMMHILEPVPQLIQIRPDLPLQIQEVLNQAMAKEPEERFSTCAEMAGALENGFKGLGEAAEPKQAASSDHTIVAPLKRPADATAPGTLVPDGRTVVTTLKPTGPGDKTAILPNQPGAGAAPAAAAARRKGGFPIWLVALLALGLLGLAAVAIIFGSRLFATAGKPTSTQAVVAVATHTPQPTLNQDQPTATQASALLLTGTAAVSPSLPSDTPAPSATSAPTATLEPTATSAPTATATPSAVILGGADKMAFISDNDVWTANLDGSELTQLTTDGAVKTSLQWLPDGKRLVFINGKCIKLVEYPIGRQELITCFDSAAYLNDFQVSPDGKQVAISIDNEYLFVVPFDLAKLKNARLRRELAPMGTCKTLSPLDKILVRSVRWSTDGSKLAFVFAAPIGGRREDTIRVIDISKCYDIFPRVGVEFPNNWFSIKGYDKNPSIPNFGWNGAELFVLNGLVRNGGFGDMYIFNNDLVRVQSEVNPINNSCCYRGVQFSPDGHYLIFAYQAISADNQIQLYMVPVGTLGTGEKYTPIPLPDTLFTARDSNPQPVLRKAAP